MRLIKSRFFTLTISTIMALSVMLVTPAFVNVFNTSDTIPVFQEACASGNGSCCPRYNASCGMFGRVKDDAHYQHQTGCDGNEEQTME